jgi:hypothetical protein
MDRPVAFGRLVHDDHEFRPVARLERPSFSAHRPRPPLGTMLLQGPYSGKGSTAPVAARPLLVLAKARENLKLGREAVVPR